jgi:hypothetical protein
MDLEKTRLTSSAGRFYLPHRYKRAANRLPPPLSWETEELYAKAKEIVVVISGDRRSLGDFGAGVS